MYMWASGQSNMAALTPLTLRARQMFHDLNGSPHADALRPKYTEISEAQGSSIERSTRSEVQHGCDLRGVDARICCRDRDRCARSGSRTLVAAQLRSAQPCGSATKRAKQSGTVVASSRQRAPADRRDAAPFRSRATMFPITITFVRSTRSKNCRSFGCCTPKHCTRASARLAERAPGGSAGSARCST
jgi:hypothetical protein